MGRDRVKESNRFHVVGAYFSPVNDNYKKPGLISAKHRVRMCELCCDKSSWIMVDSWEARQPAWCTTRNVLAHFDKQINSYYQERKYLLVFLT
jgi:nicotinamide mononucleotide adenylyltransferase